MSKMTGLIGGLALMTTTLVAAAPQVTTPQPAPRATAEAAQPLPWEPQQTAAVCNLLCVIGDHCCIINNKATCIPNSIPCPPQ